MDKKERPDCYRCKHRCQLRYSAHSKCSNSSAKVEGHEQGRRGGWFNRPSNFDPVWLQECDGFEERETEILESDLIICKSDESLC